MKLGNFLRFDPNYKGKGLTAGGKLEEVIWNEFAQDHQKLKNAAEFIRLGAEIYEVTKEFQITPPLTTRENFKGECLRNGERELENSVLEMSDKQFIEYLNKLDSSACLDVKEGLVKIRKYNKKIINDLKERCNYCCQICSYSSVEEYGASIVETISEMVVSAFMSETFWSNYD